MRQLEITICAVFYLCRCCALVSPHPNGFQQSLNRGLLHARQLSYHQASSTLILNMARAQPNVLLLRSAHLMCEEGRGTRSHKGKHA